MQNFKEKFLGPENFQLAWEKVAAKNGCAGVDRESVAHFAKNAEAYLSQLMRSLASGYYHPLPLRQLFIPKKAGGWRELGVPTVRDRIVQNALLTNVTWNPHPQIPLPFWELRCTHKPFCLRFKVSIPLNPP